MRLKVFQIDGICGERIVTSDLEIVNILGRSPESFRSSDNLNLENNIKFHLYSVGLTDKATLSIVDQCPVPSQ